MVCHKSRGRSGKEETTRADPPSTSMLTGLPFAFAQVGHRGATKLMEMLSLLRCPQRCSPGSAPLG